MNCRLIEYTLCHETLDIIGYYQTKQASMKTYGKSSRRAIVKSSVEWHDSSDDDTFIRDSLNIDMKVSRTARDSDTQVDTISSKLNSLDLTCIDQKKGNLTLKMSNKSNNTQLDR